VRVPMAVSMIVAGLVLGFAVTASPSWLSIGMLGSTLVIAGAAGLLIGVLGRLSHARRQRWHAVGPWLMIAGGALWLALRLPYMTGLDPVSLGFILALTGLVVSCLAAYLVSPWRGSGVVGSWLRPGTPRSGTRGPSGAYAPQSDTYSPRSDTYSPRSDTPGDDPTVLLPPYRDDRFP